MDANSTVYVTEERRGAVRRVTVVTWRLSILPGQRRPRTGTLGLEAATETVATRNSITTQPVRQARSNNGYRLRAVSPSPVGGSSTRGDGVSAS